MSQDDHLEGFPIGKLSMLSGCPIETIRYYERAGILQTPPRSASGRRLYSMANLHQLNFVRRGRDLGFSLDRVKQLLMLAEQVPVDHARVRAIVTAHLEETQRKIAELQRIVDRLNIEATEGDSILAALQGKPRTGSMDGH